MMKLTLIFREYCSLCHQMRAELLPLQQEWGFALEVLDVDSCAEWEAKYNELVPVLLDGEVEICHWHLDKAKLMAHLQQTAC